MRVNGDAHKVTLSSDGEEPTTITVGEDFEGMMVQRLFVGMEDSMVFVRLSSATHARFLTFQHRQAKVDWGQSPNIQSRTEWTMWLAEAVGHMKDMAPMGLEPELRKFYPLDEMPQPGGAAPTVAPPGHDFGYKPIPLNPNEGPKLRVVNKPTPEEQVDAYMKKQAVTSSQKEVVDNDAGGPEGFDPDAVPSAVSEVDPVDIAPVVISPPMEGKRMIMVKKEGVDIDLTGRKVQYEGQVATVKSVELSEHEGEEVLCLIVV